MGSGFPDLPFSASFRHLYVPAICYHQTSTPFPCTQPGILFVCSNPLLVFVRNPSTLLALPSVLTRQLGERLPSAFWTESICTLIFRPLKGPLLPPVALFHTLTYQILAYIGKHNCKIKANMVSISLILRSLVKYSIISTVYIL